MFCPIAGANALLDADFTAGTADPYTFGPAGGVAYADYVLKISALTGLTFTDGFHYDAPSYAKIAQHAAAALALAGVA